MPRINEIEKEIAVANDLSYIKNKGIIPSSFFLGIGFQSIIVNCGWCSKNGGDEERYTKVRKGLKECLDLSQDSNKKFTEYCMELCNACDYSRGKIYDLVERICNL